MNKEQLKKAVKKNGNIKTLFRSHRRKVQRS